MPRKLDLDTRWKKTGTTAIQTLLSQQDGSIILLPRTGRAEKVRKSHQIGGKLTKIFGSWM